MIFINKHLTLIVLSPFLIIFCAHAGKVINKPTLNTSSLVVHLNEVNGWNHLSNDTTVEKIINNSPTKYKIITTQVVDINKSSINISTILVRKLANWHQQHSNGIKINLEERDLSFGQFNGVNFTIRINHIDSVIPSIEQAEGYYMKEIEKGNIKLQWLKELLREPPKITLTLYGAKHDNENISTPMARFSYKIEPTNDKKNVNISSSSFSYYWQQNYQELVVSQNILANYKVSGMLFTLDTSTNKTLRSLMSSEQQINFPKTVDELLLELKVTIEDPIIKLSLDM
jgi:hypothetical protein